MKHMHWMIALVLFVSVLAVPAFAGGPAKPGIVPNPPASETSPATQAIKAEAPAPVAAATVQTVVKVQVQVKERVKTRTILAAGQDFASGINTVAELQAALKATKNGKNSGGPAWRIMCAYGISPKNWSRLAEEATITTVQPIWKGEWVSVGSQGRVRFMSDWDGTKCFMIPVGRDGAYFFEVGTLNPVLPIYLVHQGRVAGIPGAALSESLAEIRRQVVAACKALEPDKSSEADDARAHLTAALAALDKAEAEAQKLREQLADALDANKALEEQLDTAELDAARARKTQEAAEAALAQGTSKVSASADSNSGAPGWVCPVVVIGAVALVGTVAIVAIALNHHDDDDLIVINNTCPTVSTGKVPPSNGQVPVPAPALTRPAAMAVPQFSIDLRGHKPSWSIMIPVFQTRF